MEVILDRVLHQGKERFPALAKIKFEQKQLSFQDLLPSKKADLSGELTEGLRYLLIELLTVLGRLTADILTAPLRKELFSVTWTDSEET